MKLSGKPVTNLFELRELVGPGPREGNPAKVATTKDFLGRFKVLHYKLLRRTPWPRMVAWRAFKGMINLNSAHIIETRDITE